MDVKQAIATAKQYVGEVYSDEGVTNLGLEETEFDPGRAEWHITLAFSRPWNTPRTRAQEVLEQLGAVSTLKRSYKLLVIRDDGTVLSMKDRIHAEAAG